MSMCLPFVHILKNTVCFHNILDIQSGHKEEINYLWRSTRLVRFHLTYPVNSLVSELGWGPDHYLTIHSVVSQSYLKELPWLRLWKRSSSLVKSLIVWRESSAATVFMAAIPQQIYANAPSKFNWKASFKSDSALDKYTACVNLVIVWKYILST